MAGSAFGERNDLRPPCNRDGKVCEKKHMGCQDTCDNPEYLEVLRLRKLRAEDHRKRMDIASQEVSGAIRRRKGRR